MAQSSQQNRWLDVQVESTPALKYVLPSCMTLCDLKNDGYYKLLVTEIPLDEIKSGKPKLKIFKGVTQLSERTIPGIASGLCTLYMEEPDPKIPIIGIAIGPSVLLYRNLKPYYKYSLPNLDIEPLEIETWKQLENATADNIEEHMHTLKSLNFSRTSNLTRAFLSCTTDEDRLRFIKETDTTKIEQRSVITCMSPIQKNSSDPKATTCLIVAAECGDIYILDSNAFSVLQQAKVCATPMAPVSISALGYFDVDFNIVIYTREQTVCILKKGWLEGQQIAQVESPITGISLLPIEQTIIVVCTDQCLLCFSKRGKRMWYANLPSRAVCMTPMTLTHLGITLICVALEGGKVHIYLQKNLVDEFCVDTTVAAMIFGRLGQEDHVLVLITITGQLVVKILKRTSTFNADTAYDESLVRKRPDEENLVIQKKSKVFLEQINRERENASAIHNTYQAEFWRLRLTAARETLDMINASEGTFSSDMGHAPIKLSAEVLGTGPEFKMYLQIENMSTTKATRQLSLLLHANHRHFKLNKSFTYLPMLVPRHPIKLDFEVTVIMEMDNMPAADLTQDNSMIKVLIIREKQAKPLIASTIVIPLVPIF